MKETVLNYDFVYRLLEQKTKDYNRKEFIQTDPISIPHRFTKKQDIEIIGFWIAMMAWGNRKAIINSGNKLVELMEGTPYDFILNHREKDLKRFLFFKHRNFLPTDALYFIEFFKNHYANHESLEDAFVRPDGNLEIALIKFHQYFFSLEDAPYRTQKHVATPERNSACKRMNMFLRWMVRKDKCGVDFGIWKKIKPSQLFIPLDVHVDRTARKLGLIKRKQTDWETVVELTGNLKQFDPKDPAKYDFALFGLSVLDKMEIH
jgi:uncharacterized protein (TIGR02757 family)